MSESNMVSITIDGDEYKAKEGEYILNAARANGVFIPAICYLTRCSPTLACRICLVEADGKQVYACNAKVKDGMDITITTPNIQSERRAIMEVYDVNHPLQCGVCDKSGECELQNYTLELKVDTQNYSIADTKREVKDWSSVLHYDAGLCIVCEKCTTVCKDMIGDSAITTVKRGGDVVDKAYKESMPKDAYAMWNKLQKSIIAPSNGTDFTNCSDCGECIAVCPVGALASKDFVYKSNAWDLKRVPAISPHSSDGAFIYYEVKPTSIENREEMIYRVTNDWSFVSLDGSARFAYDFENKNVTKNPEDFTKTLEAFEKCETIRFNSLITNEEALMLQTLKEEKGIKLYNPEVRNFQKFLRSYGESSGNSLYQLDTSTIMQEADFVISVGSALRHDSPALKYTFNNVQKLNKGAGLYFHPISDSLISSFGKNVISVTHNVGTEEAVIYLLVELFGDKEKLSDEVKTYIEETDFFAILGQDKDSFTTSLDKALKKKEKFVLMVGEDFYYHPKAKNLAKIIGLLEATTDIKTIIAPPKSNALGVALICKLDDEATGYTIGYNEIGDFRLSALGDGDLDIPALNQQEGTLTNINKRVAPTNSALAYCGYELNDIMKALFDDMPELTIEWTPLLPKEKGFKEIEFDNMTNSFSNDGTDNRGYLLETTKKYLALPTVEKFEEVEIKGQIAYRCNPARQFNDFTNKAHEIFEPFGAYVSQEKALELGEKVEVTFEKGSIELDVIVDDKMSGDIIKISDFISSNNIYELFDGKRYQNITIKKV